MRGICVITILCLVAALGSAPTAASAQAFNSQAAQRRFQDLYSAGDYRAALVEAQKTEAAARRNGTNNINYFSALNDVARAHNKLGHYAESATMFERVVDALQNNIPANDGRLLQAKNNLADAYVNLTRYDRAETLYKQTLEVMTTLVPAGHPNLVEVTTRLGTVYLKQSRYDAAETQFKQALSMAEANGRPDSPQAAVALNNLSKIYEDQGRFSEVEAAIKRALKINQTTFGDNHPEVAININNLAHLYERLGRYAEAEGLYRRVIAVWEGLNPNHPELATALQNLGTVLADEERLDEAEALYKRALDIREQTFGPNNFLVATEYNNLAQLYELQGRYADVEIFAKRALAIVEATKSSGDPDTAKVMRKLGAAYDQLGRYDEAGEQFRRAIDIFTKAFGPNHRFLATVLINQGHLFEHLGRLDEADRVYQRALAINERSRGDDHPDVARALNNLALLSASRHDVAKAVAYSRRATAAILAHAALDKSGPQLSSSVGGLIERRTGYFGNHVANLAALADVSGEQQDALGREAFQIAQWASQSSAAAAVQQMAARFATGDGPLAALARQSQDLAAAWRETDRRLLEALSSVDSSNTRARIETLRARSAELESRLAVTHAKLDKDFPEYAALVNPKPVSVVDIQSLLSATEALVFWLPDDHATYVFALTHDRFDWRTIPLNAETLLQKIAAFRVGLDPDRFLQSLSDGKPEQFDLGIAYELYSALLGPVEPLIKDKHDLIVAAAGSVTALPVHAVVTEKPEVAKPGGFIGYRDAAWLLKHHAVTVVPSVASFRALRTFVKKADARKPMVGFGDPIFHRDQAPAGRQRAIRSARSPTYSQFWRGAGVDRTALSMSLPQLPDTADELNAVARRLHVPAADIHLGKDASETTLKHLPLSDYKIVYFATHGLVAGDVKGLAEPSLVLTLPEQPSDFDDGLLTASEVAQLKLNADFVVLSACNTIAGDRPGAEALSGLARAFFYAGARALLVSHWNVESKAATEIVSEAIKNLSTADVGRAEALRQAMLKFLETPGEGHINAYPAFWAPFAIVGEGARR